MEENKRWRKNLFFLLSCPLRGWKTAQMERENRVENRAEKWIMSPLSSESTLTTYFLHVCSVTKTFTFTHKHKNLKAWHFTLTFQSLCKKKKSLFCSSHWTAPCQSAQNRREKTLRWSLEKRRATLPLGERKMKEMKEEKFIPNWMLTVSPREMKLISAHLTSVFQPCQIINVTSLRERLWTKC